jgi:hypothetical protein
VFGWPERIFSAGLTHHWAGDKKSEGPKFGEYENMKHICNQIESPVHYIVKNYNMHEHRE